jgi:transposase-like protein
MDTNPSKQRQQFYRDYASGQWSMSELCDRYQISRPTGYKWVDRIENESLKAVKDRSRAPFGHPNRIPERVEREILAPSSEVWLGRHEASTDHRKKASTWRVPARSTVNELLERHGKLKKSRRKRLWKHPGAVRLETAGSGSRNLASGGSEK